MTTRAIVSMEAWKAARQELLAKEKAATRARDALAAERRRLPMVRIEKAYAFRVPRARRACPTCSAGGASSSSTASSSTPG